MILVIVRLITEKSIGSVIFDNDTDHTVTGRVIKIAFPYSLCLLLSAAAIATGFAASANASKPEPEQPPSQEQPSPIEAKARKALAAEFPGRIIFDSNRGKGFGIFTTDPTGEKVEAFVDSPLHEMYPDVSPDGKFVVFSRSDELDKRGHFSIWLVPTSGGAERKLAEKASFPTFSADGKSVYFERDRERVMKIELATGKESEIFPLASTEWHKREIVKPRVSPDGRFVAFISRVPKRWSAWYANLETREAVHVGKGCEPTWSSNGQKIAWISGAQALERSSVAEFDVATGAVAKLHDADAPRGHEYFPTFAAKGSYLLFSAARPGEHDPLSANYQLFAKNLKTGEVTRITFDPHTNRWPKLLAE